MFNNLIDTARSHLSVGDTDRATMLLDRARVMAYGREERKMAHDFANEIQIEIYAQYLKDA
jgi:hypothetical protein